MLPTRQPCAKPSLPSEDSEADDDLLTLKAMSESLSYCEPPGDPEGETVTGLDCTVPASTGEDSAPLGQRDTWTHRAEPHGELIPTHSTRAALTKPTALNKGRSLTPVGWNHGLTKNLLYTQL